MVDSKINTFDIKFAVVVFEVIEKFGLVCCIYKTGRGLSSAKAITSHCGYHNVVFL